LGHFLPSPRPCFPKNACNKTRDLKISCSSRLLASRACPCRAGDAFAAKAAAYVDLLDNPGSMDDPTPDAPEPDDLHNPGDRPGRAVRQQTRDLISLLEAARHRATYYMFMEDDFRWEWNCAVVFLKICIFDTLIYLIPYMKGITCTELILLLEAARHCATSCMVMEDDSRWERRQKCCFCCVIREDGF